MTMNNFETDGFVVIEGVITEEECTAIEQALSDVELSSAGTRNLLKQPWCIALARRVRTHPRVADFIPDTHAAVQCTYFEKSRKKNWLVSFHQDQSIPVAERIEHPALTGWSEKEGVLYVQPPADVLSDMVAVRVHVDRCGEADGPIKVLSGSHRLGAISAEQVPAVRSNRAEVACVAGRGTALIMRPLLLHASSKASGSSRRRVLHFLFGPRALPYPLRWPT
jgi:hypothetical protein